MNLVLVKKSHQQSEENYSVANNSVKDVSNFNVA